MHLPHVNTTLLSRVVAYLTDFITAVSKLRQDRAYLATKISLLLDEFARDCYRAAHDDGTCCGQTDQDGYYRPQTPAPKLDLDKYPVEWKSLTPKLMYKTQRLPFATKETESLLSGYADVCGPPYDDYMEERQLQYAKLGIQAMELAEELRAAAGIPSHPLKEDEYYTALQYRVETIDERQAKQIEANRKMLEELNTPRRETSIPQL